MKRGAAFSFEIDSKELEEALAQLPKSMSKTVMRNACKKAAIPIRDEAVATVPMGPRGNLAKSIKVSTKLKKSQQRWQNRDRSRVEVYVGSDAPHAHLVEWGTQERFQKKRSNKSVGDMPSNPWFTRAFDATKGKALEIMLREISNELVKAAKRLATKAEKRTLGKAAVRKLLE
jgi:HK97 gp10 family phage protein